MAKEGVQNEPIQKDLTLAGKHESNTESQRTQMHEQPNKQEIWITTERQNVSDSRGSQAEPV
jgi:hypothetical protein